MKENKGKIEELKLYKKIIQREKEVMEKGS